MAAKKKPGPAYKRILLKLSGEALQSPDKSQSLDTDVLVGCAGQLKKVHAMGVQVAIVVGGGNIWRGLAGSEHGIARTTADHMGMLATVINSLALQSALENLGVPTRVMTAIEMSAVAEPFIRRRALRHLEKERVVIFGAGTGNPYFSTDTAAALRANEIDCDVLLKGTKVDGIYSADPVKDPKAKRYKSISYREALTKQLKVMDAAAFSLCMENSIPITVFDFFKANEIVRVVEGRNVGTRVSHESK